MGICKLCGKDVGWLRSSHKECEQRYERGKRLVESTVVDAVRRGVNLKIIQDKARDFGNSFGLDLAQVKAILLNAWDNAAEDAVSENLLTKEKETRLMELGRFFGADPEALTRRPVYPKLVKAAVIRDLCEGKVPPPHQIYGQLPLALQKKEQVIWVFNNTKYYESQTRTHYVGGSQGMSFRVMKGVYYRAGAFRGEPVQITNLVHVDTGLFIVTNKHLTFIGQEKSVRLKHEKIISYTPYSDGIGVCRDAVTAKPQIFVTDDGWFTYNVIVNAAKV